ncbi:MAG: folate family ECF transporter S component [Clostridia bacterium]|nr:folate family ECF transporter S component [Clostridia bacterium]
MSAFLFISGMLLFACGAFGLYSGLYTGNSRAGEFARKIREALSQHISDPKTVLIAVGACLACLGVALVIWGYTRAKREKKSGTGMSIHVLTVLAMLVAMTVMLDRFPGLSVKTPGWKIGFSFVPPMIAAILYGPIEAAIVYGLSDLIGALLFPFGPYHPGFTVVAALMGFVMGMFLNKRPFAFAKSGFEWKKIRFFPNQLLPVLINAAVLGLFVNTYWVSQLYGSKTYWGWFLYRLVEYAVLVPVQLLLIPVLLKLCDTLKKAGLGGRDRHSASQERIRKISRSESILGLERIRELLSLLDDPQDEFNVIHVAGTNGKGSFTAMLDSVLREAGYKVGTFTSPAITGVTDSFRVDGEKVAEEVLDERLSEIEPYIKQMAEKPTEFEVMTAAAYELFAQENCDIAIVECGLGGAGDSTNVIEKPLLSVITNVQLDHTDRLGRTLKEIAVHKAGIIKKGRPVLFGGSEPEAEAVVARRAEELSAPLTHTDKSRLHVSGMSLDGTDISFDGMGDYHLSLIGAYQPENAANVLTAVEMLRGMGLEIPDEAVKTGLASAVWHGRFEIVGRDPIVIFDGSHNPAGVELAAKSIRSCFDCKAVLLMGVMADKDYESYPDMLRPLAEKVYTVKPANPRALGAEELAEVFSQSGIPAEACASIEEGVRAARQFASERGLPMIGLGTLYMYQDFVNALN